MRVFDAVTGIQVHEILACALDFTGGVRVGAVRADGDLFADIVTGPGPGMEPLVKVFSGLPASPTPQLQAFHAYDAGFTGGVFVAGGNVVAAVPEPGSASLLALGGAALVVGRRRRGGRTPAAPH